MIDSYIFLGSRGSGRREVMLDLARTGVNPASDRVVILLPSGEAADDLDGALQALDHVSVEQWRQEEAEVIIPDLSDSTTHVFIMVDGDKDPVDQLEALRNYFEESADIELARIITVLDSRFLFEKPEIEAWYDACVHFSDVVLFNRREDVPNKWFSDYQQRFNKLCYPAMFDSVKKGRVRNPAEILYPEPRRMSQAFDFDMETTQESFDNIDLILEIEDEDEDSLDAISEEDNDEGIPDDPYFERNLGGQRIKRIPDIKAFREGE